MSVSNSLNLAELVVNESMESISKKLLLFFSPFDLPLFNVKISRAYNARTR